MDKIEKLTECSINKVTWARKVNFGFVDHVCTCRSLIEMDNLQSYQINRAEGTGGGGGRTGCGNCPPPLNFRKPPYFGKVLTKTCTFK